MRLAGGAHDGRFQGADERRHVGAHHATKHAENRRAGKDLVRRQISIARNSKGFVERRSKRLSGSTGGNDSRIRNESSDARAITFEELVTSRIRD